MTRLSSSSRSLRSSSLATSSRGAAATTVAAEVAKRYAIELCDCRLRSIKPDGLLDGRRQLLGESQDRLAGSFGPAFGSGPLPLFGHGSANRWYAPGAEPFRDGPLLRRQAREQGVAMRRAGFEAGRHTAWRRFRLSRARSRRSARVGPARFASWRSRATRRALNPGASRLTGRAGATLSGARRIGPRRISTRGVSTRRGARGPSRRSRRSLGPPATGHRGIAGGRLRAASVSALAVARRAAIPGRGPVATAGTVEQVAAVAPATPLGDENRRYGRHRLGGAQQLDPTREGHLLLGRQNRQDRDPVDLDLRLDAQDVAHFGVVGEDSRIYDTLRLPRSGGAPCVAAVTPNAGELDVETIWHAPVKLQGGAGPAKRATVSQPIGSPCPASYLPTRYNVDCGA